jgi:hypothetical protein
LSQMCTKRAKLGEEKKSEIGNGEGKEREGKY